MVVDASPSLETEAQVQGGHNPVPTCDNAALSFAQSSGDVRLRYHLLSWGDAN